MHLLLFCAPIQLFAQVTYGAENEKIPTLGDTVKIYLDSTKILQQWRNEHTLTIIEYSRNRKKDVITVYPLENLKNKNVTKFYENGSVRLIADYKWALLRGNL